MTLAQLRRTVAKEVLEELGVVTLVYARIEELLTIMTVGLENPAIPENRRVEISKMGMQAKLSLFRSAALKHCDLASGDIEKFDSVVTKAKWAIQKRDDLVHGFPAFEVNHRTGTSRWIAKRPQLQQAHALTTEDVRETGEDLFTAYTELDGIASLAWSTRKPS